MSNNKSRSLLLSNKNYSLLFYGNLVSRLGDVFYNFAIGWFILSFTKSAAQAGYYMAFGAVVYLLIAPFGGAIVDRLDRVKVLYITDIIRGIAVLTSGILIFNNYNESTQLIILYITSFIISINGALFSPAVTAITPYIVDKERLQEANSLISAQGQLISIFGVVLGATLYSIIGIGWIFIINGISYIVSGISELFIKVNSKVEHSDEMNFTTILKDMKLGLLYLLKNRGLTVLMVIALFINFFLAPFFSNIYPFIYNQILSAKPIHLSLVNVSFSIGFIVMAIILSKKQQQDKVSPMIKKGLMLWIPLIILLIGAFTLVLNNNISVIIFTITNFILMLIMGFSNSYINIPLGVAFQKYVDKEMLGRVSSITNTLSQAATPIAVALGGIILDIEGFSVIGLSLICFSGFTICVLIALFNKDFSTI